MPALGSVESFTAAAVAAVIDEPAGGAPESSIATNGTPLIETLVDA